MMRLACLAMLLGFLIAGPALADTITLNPSWMVNVQSGPGQNTNNAYGPYMIRPSSDNNQGLLSFDLSSIKVPVASATLKILQASNVFYAFQSPPPPMPGGPAGSYNIYGNTSAWQQNTVTWNTKPSVNPVSVATLALTQFNTGWQSWDVTSLVNAWITGSSTNFGLTIGRSDPGTPSVFLMSGPAYLPTPPGSASPQGFPADQFLPELILNTNAVATAPEPASLIMAGIAALGLIGYRRRRSLG
jgi:hypothetical protein